MAMISDWIMSLRKCEKLMAPRTLKRGLCGFDAVGSAETVGHAMTAPRMSLRY